MDKRFFKLYNLTEEEAIAVLDTPQDLIKEHDSRYIAAAHLVNFSTDNSIKALIRAVQNTDPSLDNQIVRRKSVETLGNLQTQQAIPVIRTCLADEDCYLVENAVWAMGEIGTQDEDILKEIAQLLDKPGQTYRVIIQTLAKLNYHPALNRISQFINAQEETIASAAISAVCRLSGDYTLMSKVVAFLQHRNVIVRRSCIQDLMDSCYYPAIPAIAGCPVSLVFRLRAIRAMASVGMKEGVTFEEIQPSLEQVLRDHPDTLNLVHQYEQPPTLEFVIRELYHTDFGRCYRASKTLLEMYPDQAPDALLATYAQEAHNDYGAHYHVMKLLGWLNYAPAYDLLMKALHNQAPQFQKSRAAAAIALGELGDKRAISALQDCLKTHIWDLKYASLMTLGKLGDTTSYEIVLHDSDELIRAKASSFLTASTAVNL